MQMFLLSVCPVKNFLWEAKMLSDRIFVGVEILNIYLNQLRESL